MTIELTAVTDLAAFQPETFDVGWPLATRVDPFLDWLDESGLGATTELALAKFMKFDIAKKMPATLRNDLRAAGWFEAADYAEAHPE